MPYQNRLRTPILFASHIRAEGRVRWPEEWNEYDPIIRADMLADWITELQTAWIVAVKTVGPEKVQRRLGYFLHEGPLQ